MPVLLTVIVPTDPTSQVLPGRLHRVAAAAPARAGVVEQRQRVRDNAIASVSPRPGGALSGLRSGLEVDTDRPGAVYRDLQLDIGAPEVCQATCAGDDACRSWTFVPGGYLSDKPHCQLHPDTPAATPHEGRVSGLKGVEFATPLHAPGCAGRACGPDGFGGSCGTCAEGSACSTDGQCAPLAACAGKPCGPDGLGGSCGTCPWHKMCSAASTCVCAPRCEGRVCGDDDCGGSCGNCKYGSCSDGQCVCTPNCAGKTCGDDGCGGSCGSCDSNQVCNGGSCCQPQTCAGRCGYVSNGCGGTIYCGSCTCTPSCANKKCGAWDGCGDYCPGTCGSPKLQCARVGKKYACVQPGGGN